MAVALRRTCLKVKENILKSPKPQVHYEFTPQYRAYCNDNIDNQDFSNSTILVENGFNVQELPVVIRKLKDVEDVKDSSHAVTTYDSSNYSMIQAEFQQCSDLREVFSLLSKCTKITPNIALGAMERIYDMEQKPATFVDKGTHVNLAKGAILDKLLKVIVKTDDTQTILNVLKSISSFMDPYKHKFCDELLLRTIDNKMSVEQICTFTQFLIENKFIPKYADTIDKLWVGFIEKECDINETNIAMVFSVLPGLKLSKKIILNILEQRLSELWSRISIPAMQEILNSFVETKYLPSKSLATIGWWLHMNIHALDEDSLLDIVSKITRLKYFDASIEKAIEKYMKMKGKKIESHIVIVGILNYCMQLQIRNEQILNSCGQYLLKNVTNIPPSFLKSHIYPYGFLNYDPFNDDSLWAKIENVLLEKHLKINIDDLSSILLSFLYLGKHPLKLVNNTISMRNFLKTINYEAWRNINLVDTALALECNSYMGPLIPKEQWPEPVVQDSSIKNIVKKIYENLKYVAGGADKLSTHVMVPHFSDKTYLIDVMIHPSGLGESTFNWKLKSSRNHNVAILIQFPDHYCSDNKHLIGPQVMRKKHLRILGFKVVSIDYSTISQLYSSYKKNELSQYLMDSLENAEDCI